MEFIRLISEIEYRKERLWMRVFLKLCGFCLLEQDAPADLEDFPEEDRLDELTIYIGNKSADFYNYINNSSNNSKSIFNHISIILLDNIKGYTFLSVGEPEKDALWFKTGFFKASFWTDFLNKLQTVLLPRATMENQANAISLLAGCYDLEVMSSVYLLDDLYASYRMSYSETAVLEQAVQILQKLLGDDRIRKKDTQSRYPRVAFACAFVADKVNECMLRLKRPFIYTVASIIDIIKNQLSDITYLNHASLLLESVILENECLGSQQLQNLCVQIEEVFPKGYKYKGSFLFAESRYDMLEMSSGVYDEKMLNSYLRCVDDNPRHFRSLYKIALCCERQGIAQRNNQIIENAISEYENISKIIDAIDMDWRSSLEWEYNFKAKFRAAVLLRRQKDLKKSLLYLEKCEEEIKYLNTKGLPFCDSVYGGIIQSISSEAQPDTPSVSGVIRSKYVRTLSIISNMLNEVRKELAVLN